MTTTFSKLTLLFFASLLLEATFAQELFTSAAKMKLATKKEIMYRLPNLPKEQKITVGILDGYAIFEGDIVLYKEGQQKDAGIIGNNYRWENGVIPYVIADGHPLAADIRRAIDLMNLETNLCIRPRTNERDYLLIINGNGAYSYIGRQGGEQILSYTSGYAFGSIMHELLHAAGMYHEQCRSDRDNYVRIDFQSIESGAEGNFGKFNTISSCAYDFGSIMHYSLKAFSNNGSPTIVPLVPIPTGISVGQRTTLSACDIEGIRSLYPNVTGCSPIDGKTYMIQSVSSDLVLDIPCGVQDDLISVFQWRQHGGSNQRWTLKRTADGYFQIMVNSSNKCLDVLYASKNDMATIVQYTCHGGDHQKWRFRDAGNGSVYITSKASNKVLDVLYWSKIQGTAIVQHTLLNQANQQWRLIQK